MKVEHSRIVNRTIKKKLKYTIIPGKYILIFKCEKTINAFMEEILQRRIKINANIPLKGCSFKITPTLQVIHKGNYECIICKKKAVKLVFNRNTISNKLQINFYVKGNVLLTKDHIVPLSKGGKNDLTNYQCMCQTCNNEKSNMSNFKFLKKKGLLNWDNTFKLSWFEYLLYKYLLKVIKL